MMKSYFSVEIDQNYAFNIDSIFVLLEQEIANNLIGMLENQDLVNYIVNNIKNLAAVLSKRFPEHFDLLTEVSDNFSQSDIIINNESQTLSINLDRFKQEKKTNGQTTNQIIF